MGGVLKSTGCQACKDRRIKCDLKWPVCTPCKRRRMNCPGPSSLFKFVNKEGQSKQQPDSTIAPINSQSRHKQLRSHESSGHTGVFRAFPAPRNTPTSLADRVGSVLVKNIESDLGIDGYIAFRYLKHLPGRLENSQCLRDAALLFCAAVGDYRNTVTGKFETLKRYGNALRSLQRSLESKDGDHLETLTSVAIIGRSESFFDSAWKPFQQIHTEGILWLTIQLGPPKAGDEFHSSVVFENFEFLLLHFLTTGAHCFLNDPGWREATLEASLAYIHKGLRESAGPVLDYCYEYSATTGQLLRRILMIRNNPQDPMNKAMAMQVMESLSKMVTKIREDWDNFFDNAMRLGELSEVVDADSILGISYKPSNCVFGSYILMAVSLQASQARIRYDLSELYGMDDAQQLWHEYVRISNEMWKYIPWPLRMDRIFAAKTLMSIVLTFDAADEKGKEYLLNAIRDHHSEKHHLPKDTEHLTAAIAFQNMALTGRLPFG